MFLKKHREHTSISGTGSGDSVTKIRSSISLTAALIPFALYLFSGSTSGALPDLKLVLALTQPTERPPVTAVFVLDIKSGVRREIYRDEGDSRLLVKIAGSDVLGAARVIKGSEIYAMRGPAEVDSPAACSDTLSRLRLGSGRAESRWEPVFSVPLCFSVASPYGLWNRAPIFSVSPDGSRTAMPVLRIGEAALDQPAIRVLSASGAEEWKFPLPGKWMRVTDLAWSPAGTQLVYAVAPEADEHTLDEAQVAAAGLYLADIEARTTRRFYQSAARAVAWGPEPNHITAAMCFDTALHATPVVSVIALPDGVKIEEFSVAGSVQALVYSEDFHWLAIQSQQGENQMIWLYRSSGGWGDRALELTTSEGRLALLGWAEDSGFESTP